MIKSDIDNYAKNLFSRINTAILLKRTNIECGEWKPVANMCHHNVTILCDLDPAFRPIRGWLYFSLPGLTFVKFVAHSVVLAQDGEMYDITPSNASQDYPFIEGDLTEEMYAELVDGQGITEIHYSK